MKYSFFLGLLFLCINPIFALLADYDFYFEAGNWEELTGGNILGDENTDDQNFFNPENPGGQSSNNGLGLPLGFDFVFDGESFDRFGINANGWIGLGQSADAGVALRMNCDAFSPLAYSNASSAWAGKINRISAFGRDLQAQPGASLSYSTLGTAPTRRLVIEWKNYRRKNINGDSFSFQVHLCESGNAIKIVYGQMLCAGPTSASVGLRASPADVATNFATRTTANGWENSAAGGQINALAALTSENYPEPGFSFIWQPVAGIVADFNAVPQSGFAPLYVQFSDLSIAADSPLVAWHWVFGDGESSTLQNPVHSYQFPGVYDVSLTVTDAAGRSHSHSKAAYIQAFENSGFGACTLEMEAEDAVISWEYGAGEAFTPQYYFIYFNGSDDPEGDYYFLGYSVHPQRTFRHEGVGMGARYMFYRVKAVAP